MTSQRQAILSCTITFGSPSPSVKSLRLKIRRGPIQKSQQVAISYFSKGVSFFSYLLTLRWLSHCSPSTFKRSFLGNTSIFLGETMLNNFYGSYVFWRLRGLFPMWKVIFFVFSAHFLSLIRAYIFSEPSVARYFLSVGRRFGTEVCFFLCLEFSISYSFSRHSSEFFRFLRSKNCRFWWAMWGCFYLRSVKMYLECLRGLMGLIVLPKPLRRVCLLTEGMVIWWEYMEAVSSQRMGLLSWVRWVWRWCGLVICSFCLGKEVAFINFINILVAFKLFAKRVGSQTFADGKTEVPAAGGGLTGLADSYKFSAQIVHFSAIQLSTVAQSYSKSMRKRSGALHSQSEEGYIKLAHLAESHQALFYDELDGSPNRRKRKYAMSEGSHNQLPPAPTPQSQNPCPQPNPFLSFDFDQQTDAFSKDCSELSKTQQLLTKSSRKSHIVIKSTRPTSQVVATLRIILGLSQLNFSSHTLPMLQLCVHRYYLPSLQLHFTDCFWIIDETYLPSCGKLLDIYLRTCTHIVQLPGAKQCEEGGGECVGRLLGGFLEKLYVERMYFQRSGI